MSTEALLKLLVGIVTGTLVPAASAVVLLVWKASRDWTKAGAHIENLADRIKQLVERIDEMAGQLDSIRLWRQSHQATSDSQERRLAQLEDDAR
jgi:uncharacterized protein (DUF3084 family)